MHSQPKRWRDTSCSIGCSAAVMSLERWAAMSRWPLTPWDTSEKILFLGLASNGWTGNISHGTVQPPKQGLISWNYIHWKTKMNHEKYLLFSNSLDSWKLEVLSHILVTALMDFQLLSSSSKLTFSSSGLFSFFSFNLAIPWWESKRKRKIKIKLELFSWRDKEMTRERTELADIFFEIKERIWDLMCVQPSLVSWTLLISYALSLFFYVSCNSNGWNRNAETKETDHRKEFPQLTIKEKPRSTFVSNIISNQWKDRMNLMDASPLIEFIFQEERIRNERWIQSHDWLVVNGPKLLEVCLRPETVPTSPTLHSTSILLMRTVPAVENKCKHKEQPQNKMKPKRCPFKSCEDSWDLLFNLISSCILPLLNRRSERTTWWNIEETWKICGDVTWISCFLLPLPNTVHPDMLFSIGLLMSSSWETQRNQRMNPKGRVGSRMNGGS